MGAGELKLKALQVPSKSAKGGWGLPPAASARLLWELRGSPSSPPAPRSSGGWGTSGGEGPWRGSRSRGGSP
eukprot:CAMPEP_0179083480 /NCGR_PEP_ID=MMETSP0796-20121207/37700_1 /TAXON_ID=73915 /ORGANISM="Pyrodinium bahamense, Strain pbaha01" /LENGTH=71 /DNA_ID=CAMNT_0020780889 /DNA_START=36 /DNA_END=248 /DNA_ORIENTATION=+